MQELAALERNSGEETHVGLSSLKKQFTALERMAA